MNPNLKLLIGGLIGAGIGYFVADVVVEIIYLKEHTDTPEELDEMDDGFGSVTEDEFADKETFKRPTKMENKNTEKNYTRHFVPQDRPELAALVQKYNTGIDPSQLTEEEKVEDAAVEKEWEERNGPEEDFETADEVELDTDEPTVISAEEFASYDSDTMSVVNLKYYEDDVVTDEKGRPVDRPERILGDEALFAFGESSADENVVYVRNLGRNALYEVTRMNEEFTKAPTTLRKRMDEKRRRALRDKEEENGGEENNS